jgi:hypothetical protein
VADLNSSLPTVSAGNAPNLPDTITEVKPLPEGTYKPTLAYPIPLTSDSRHPVSQSSAGVVTDLRRVLDTSALWRGLAGAALLALVVAHLRAWVARVDVN